MKTFTCLKCGIEFETEKACKSRQPKYCSRSCYFKVEKTPETRQKQSEQKKGKDPWNKGVKMWEGKEHPRGTLGMVGIGKGRKITEETREKLIKSHTGLKYELNSGEKHWNWKNGATPKNEAIRKSAEYKKWRTAVFERDNYTCVKCGKRGTTIHADHIKPLALFNELSLDIDNGRTLCVSCHKQTETYGVNKKYA